MPIDATTGNNKEFSCIDASSILPTDEVMDPTLDSIVVSAFSNVEPNLDTLVLICQALLQYHPKLHQVA